MFKTAENLYAHFLARPSCCANENEQRSPQKISMMQKHFIMYTNTILKRIYTKITKRITSLFCQLKWPPEFFCQLKRLHLWLACPSSPFIAQRNENFRHKEIQNTKNNVKKTKTVELKQRISQNPQKKFWLCPLVSTAV